MEAVRKFDAEWKKQNAWEFLMRRVCLVLFYSIGSCLMLLPFGSSAWALVSSVMLFLGAMHFYIYEVCGKRKKRQPLREIKVDAGFQKGIFGSAQGVSA